MNFNSSKNQKIKDKFVGIHVYRNVNEMVSYILSKEGDPEAPFETEDIQNFFRYPEYKGTHVNFQGGTYESRQEKIDRLTILISEFDSEDQVKMSDKVFEEMCADIDALEALESEPQEVLEWWMVSDHLCEKLEALGHPVIPSMNLWGRCTSGQSISMDHAIGQICSDMGILKGQINEW